MASKGQKFNFYSPELKQEVLNKYFFFFFSRFSLGREYNISHKIISNWIHKVVPAWFSSGNLDCHFSLEVSIHSIEDFD